MNTPEKLNIWDRFFNRYRREILEEGKESWRRFDSTIFGPEGHQFTKSFVKYKIIDRLTGSERITKEYI